MSVWRPATGSSLPAIYWYSTCFGPQVSKDTQRLWWKRDVLFSTSASHHITWWTTEQRQQSVSRLEVRGSELLHKPSLFEWFPVIYQTSCLIGINTEKRHFLWTALSSATCCSEDSAACCVWTLLTGSRTELQRIKKGGDHKQMIDTDWKWFSFFLHFTHHVWQKYY